MLALLRGEFDAASAHLETAIAGLAAADMQNTSIAAADWFVVSEPLVYTHSHLAVARFMHGDLVGAETEFACAAQHAERLDFPQGPYAIGYTRMLEIGMRVARSPSAARIANVSAASFAGVAVPCAFT